MSNAVSGLYTFGSYRLDGPSRVLTRSGTVVTLAPKTFDLLVLMAESGGRLLGKRELMDALWNGAFVEEANLSFQVTTLRKLLGEEGRGWIEVVPKHGYRFTAPVERSPAIKDTASGAVPVSPCQPELSRPTVGRLRSWSIPVGIVALVAATGIATWRVWRNEKRTHDAFQVLPETSYPGRETNPSFSPDGSQIAFSWDGEKGGNSHIYVKVVGENKVLRLTSDSRPESCPTWSPDGRHIAFCRDAQDASEIVVIPALGGPERVIATLPKLPGSGQAGRPLAVPLTRCTTVNHWRGFLKQIRSHS
jgi:DNA-binding winged helix-turn-helix (wHTH) protein